MWQKRRRGITPLLLDSLHPGSLPASSPPETLGALWGRTPPHGKFYRGHARYACHAHHAKRQVYQPGLSPLSRAGLY